LLSSDWRRDSLILRVRRFGDEGTAPERRAEERALSQAVMFAV